MRDPRHTSPAAPDAEPDGRRRIGLATRAGILSAAIESLSEVGFTGTSTVEICRRAGVSRGAVSHHFPTKSELLVQAIAHLADRRLEEIEAAANRLNGEALTVPEVLDLLRSTFTGPLFRASLEIESAARTDAALMAELKPVEQKIGQSIRRTTRQLLPPDIAGSPLFGTWFHFAWSTLRGMAELQLFLREEAAAEERWRYMRPILSDALVELRTERKAARHR